MFNDHTRGKASKTGNVLLSIIGYTLCTIAGVVLLLSYFDCLTYWKHIMRFNERQLDMMQAYAYGFVDGDNNRLYTNEYEPEEPEHKAFQLGYDAGIENRN